MQEVREIKDIPGTASEKLDNPYIRHIPIERRLTMTKHISIDEHNEFHQIIELLRRAQDGGLLRSLYVDRREYKVKALSEYGEWSVSLTPYTHEPEDST